MRPIDRFILHVVHNWKNELNEAYSEKAVQGFINKFREEADDLNINITDDQLKAYINTFDRIKEKLPGDQRDLNKWTLSKFIKLVTSTKGDEAAEEMDITPDVVYHTEDGSIVIYNGSKEDNCIRYGRGEKWCITRSSFAGYRYSEGRSYPTFYLAKNNNLSDNDKLSFVAIQVRNPETTSERNRYVYTNRKNSPYESDPMSFEELLNEVPWLREIPNIKSILKYIPLSSGEKFTQQYRHTSANYREWVKFPYSAKEQYLVTRRNQKLFYDVENEEFVEKYLPKYPELAKFIAETPGIIDYVVLLKNLDKFSNQVRRSITANLQSKISTNYLKLEILPFDVKKLLVQLDKWDLGKNERLYVTKDGNTIVRLILDNDVKVGLYQEDDDYPNIKLNKRTVKYLLEYPELDKIPLRNLIELVKDELIDKNIINKVLDQAKDDPNSAIITSENGETILDSNSFAAYKKDSSGNISSIPFDDEEIQQLLQSNKSNESLQQNALNLFKAETSLPPSVDTKGLASVISTMPYDQRTYNDKGGNSVVLLTSEPNDPSFFPILSHPSIPASYFSPRASYRKGTRIEYNIFLNDGEISTIFDYLRSRNVEFNDSDLQQIFNSGLSQNTKKAIIRNNPPLTPGNRYTPVVTGEGDALYLINTANPRESLMLSSARNNLKRMSISPAVARQLLGQEEPAAAPQGQAGVQAPRRGRPAGVPNAPRQQQQAQPVAAGNLSLTTVADQWDLIPGFNTLGRTLRRFNMNGVSVPTVNDRGVSRRNNILGNTGRVVAAYEFGPSTVYIIQLTNNTRVASVVIQPGNSHYLVTSTNAYQLNSPSELLQVLQQRNLAEVHRYITNEYFERNPHHLNEFKQLLKKHINEKKNGQK